ncbi:radical SAM/SPASM domain-containing protein, partial [Paraburkholderia bannensis]|uniref:radical SAM/SPASM domain-containing protein n=1 Tax=Paraburkholderia bannensis TaxID=765414 RepID=UPI00047FD2CD
MQIKISRYTLRIPAGAVTYLVNTLSGASVALAPAELRAIEVLFDDLANDQVITPERQGLIELLMNSGFLVPIEVDERAAALEKYDRSRSNHDVLSLTIATTMECNMGCYYCFEDRLSAEKLAVPDIEGVVRFVSSRLREKGKLHVNWFGGEPLLAKDFVFEASRALIQLAESRQAGYSATIVTNGYHLDSFTAQELRRHGVTGVQVTFDGPKEVHDSVRRHLPGVGSYIPIATDIVQTTRASRRVGSYDTILNNIMSVADVMRISVRVNISRQNAPAIKLLVDDLVAAGLAGKLAAIDFAPLFNFKVNDPKKNYQATDKVHFGMPDFAEVEAELIEYVAAQGFSLKDWADPSYAGCIAVSANGFVIDSTGEVKKCDHELGVPGTAIDSLRDGAVFDADNARRWDEFRPELNAGCGDCVLLPVCYSHCPHKHMESSLERA